METVYSILFDLCHPRVGSHLILLLFSEGSDPLPTLTVENL